MDVEVVGRHCSVTDRFRQHVEDKLTRLERFAHKIIRVEVEVQKEHNPRLADRSERVEITVLSKGPAIRAEAAAEDRFAALDLALDKLLARLRKAADRRRIHRGSRTPVSVSQATAALENLDNAVADTESARGSDADTGERRSARSADSQDTAVTGDTGDTGDTETADARRTEAGIEVVGDGPLVVREKTHTAAPMTLEQALYEMELVGHDFYLFIDADTKLASVVYRRHGYDYGVIRLDSPTL
ncbi:MAG TPA: ribosome-associated translation inhibitor RaiA [Actinopolymorphaceae bacterium]